MTKEAIRLHPSPAEALPSAEIYADLLLPEGHPDGVLPYIAINMVASIDGRAAVDGRSDTLGSDVDRLLMRNIRSAFDAVLVGAGTVRDEEISLGVPEELSRTRRGKGLSGQPLGVVLAGSGRLPIERRLFGGGKASGPSRGPLAVITTSGTPTGELSQISASGGAEVVCLPGKQRPDARIVAEVLRKRFGVVRLLVEGGPSVNHSFLKGGLVDEIFLTLAPKLIGGLPPDAPGILEGPKLYSRAQLLSAYLFEDELFLRYATSSLIKRPKTQQQL